MATASVTLSVLMLKSHLNNLNFNLTMLTSQRQANVAQQAEIIAEYSVRQTNQANASTAATNAAVQQALNSLSNGDLTVALQTLQNATNSSPTSWVNDPEYMILHLQEQNLDMHQKKYETDIKATMANLEAQEKLQDSNIKEDFSPKLSIS